MPRSADPPRVSKPGADAVLRADPAAAEAPDRGQRLTVRPADPDAPRADARADVGPAATRARSRGSRDNGPSYRLLLISEHRAASEALVAHLTRHGFAIVGHESCVAKAREAARAARPDVVLIDAAVPCGWEAVVAGLDGLIAREHVAVLAAYWSNDARRAATTRGIGATLLKRVEGVVLIDRLRTLAATA